MKKSVLATGGHPDDMEQFAGGTLLLLKQAGYKVVIVALTSGECGSHTVTPEEIVRIRDKEARAGAKIIGAEFVNLGIRDGSIEYNLANTTKIVALIRDINPQIIITHPTSDYMTDHWHTGQLVLWAVPEAGHDNFPANSDAPAIAAHPYVYHTDTQGLIGSDGQIARVNTIVDITTTIEQK